VQLDKTGEQGFAFLAPRPVEIMDLLRLMDATIGHPMSEERRRQAEIVQCLFAAINAEDWEWLMALCTAEMRFFPPPGSRFHPARKLQGVGAYLAQLHAVKQRFPGYRLEEVLGYAHPKGLAVRYQASWLLPNGRTQRHTGATLFGFQGERIDQIAAWANTVTLLPLQEQAERSSAERHELLCGLAQWDTTLIRQQHRTRDGSKGIIVSMVMPLRQASCSYAFARDGTVCASPLLATSIPTDSGSPGVYYSRRGHVWHNRACPRQSHNQLRPEAPVLPVAVLLLKLAE
jgi:hypothetical protein